MADKQYIKTYPQIKIPVDGMVVSHEYNEAFKFHTHFIMVKGWGLINFTSAVEHAEGTRISVVLTSTQYQFKEQAGVLPAAASK